jgi:hypothetical protein
MILKESGPEGLELIQLAQDVGPVTGSCEYGNKPSDFSGEFVDQRLSSSQGRFVSTE